MKVQVYKNLNRGDWSVRVAGKVIAHVPSITLANVSFHVSESGRKRVIANKCREVHAWAIGEIVASQPSGEAKAITYNPYRGGTFTERASGAAVTSAAHVYFSVSEGAFAYDA
jgi:hypothetical protein